VGWGGKKKHILGNYCWLCSKLIELGGNTFIIFDDTQRHSLPRNRTYLVPTHTVELRARWNFNRILAIPAILVLVLVLVLLWSDF